MESHLKLLARVWLPGRGCCHLRSPSLTEAEALSLLHAARGAIADAQRSNQLEEVPVASGRAFVMSRRFPDPNHPVRKFPGMVLVSIPDPEIFLREAVAASLHALVVPGESDKSVEGWEFVDLGATPREPVASSGQESRHSQLLVVLGILLVVLLIVLCIYNFSGFTPGQADLSKPRSALSAKHPNAKD
jgi:hypothetical protein